MLKRRDAVAYIIMIVTATAGCAHAVMQAYPVSDHYDGVHFFNREPTPRHQLRDFLRRIQPGRARGSWMDFDSVETDHPPMRVEGDDLRVTFVNHATVLLQTHGLNILTDPVWSTRLAPVPGSALRRHRAAGIAFDDLPPIDVILISHNHFDHMDVPTLKRLVRRDHPHIIAGLGNRADLAQNGVDDVTEIDWWQSVPIGSDVTVHGVPARHWSARTVDDTDRTLWLGYVIETSSGDIYFAGDTGFTFQFEVIREWREQHERGDLRLALLPIAPGVPHDAMASRHMDAADAVRAYRVLEPQQAIAIHFGTFRQGDDGQDEQANVLADIVARDTSLQFAALRNGEARFIPALRRR